ncbi:uncharacterized protein LOC114050327 [Vombatus ursinus]|uniref:uncharacterized protein LOC114050327 n=1 Tax=Vombatus ursinus TaxID=29139 RepID=UPI000FFDBC6F|nr:uncharacterized protein LOC114050327 [Vombatus ursinus]
MSNERLRPQKPRRPVQFYVTLNPRDCLLHSCLGHGPGLRLEKQASGPRRPRQKTIPSPGSFPFPEAVTRTISAWWGMAVETPPLPRCSVASPPPGGGRGSPRVGGKLGAEAPSPLASPSPSPSRPRRALGLSSRRVGRLPPEPRSGLQPPPPQDAGGPGWPERRGGAEPEAGGDRARAARWAALPLVRRPRELPRAPLPGRAPGSGLWQTRQRELGSSPNPLRPRPRPSPPVPSGGPGPFEGSGPSAVCLRGSSGAAGAAWPRGSREGRPAAGPAPTPRAPRKASGDRVSLF